MAGCILSTSSCVATKQAIYAVDNIEPGMTKVQVTEILGHPLRQHSKENREAWEYCLVGFGANDYIVVYFEGAGVSNRVSGLDDDWGMCRSRFREFEWPEEARTRSSDRA